MLLVINFYLLKNFKTKIQIICYKVIENTYQNTGKPVAYSRDKFEASAVAAHKLVAITDRFDCQPEMHNKFDKKFLYRI